MVHNGLTVPFCFSNQIEIDDTNQRPRIVLFSETQAGIVKSFLWTTGTIS